MSSDPGVCHDDVCITCGDVAVALTIITIDGDTARCRADSGKLESVALDLVGRVAPGDRVLVHAGVALATLPNEPNRTTGVQR